MQEAMVLLKVTNWSVSEIAYVLGYETFLPGLFILLENTRNILLLYTEKNFIINK